MKFLTHLVLSREVIKYDFKWDCFPNSLESITIETNTSMLPPNHLFPKLRHLSFFYKDDLITCQYNSVKVIDIRVFSLITLERLENIIKEVFFFFFFFF